MTVPHAKPFPIKRPIHRFEAKQNNTRPVSNVSQAQYLQDFLKKKKLPIGLFTLLSFPSRLRGRAGSPHWPPASVEAVER